MYRCQVVSVLTLEHLTRAVHLLLRVPGITHVDELPAKDDVECDAKLQYLCWIPWLWGELSFTLPSHMCSQQATSSGYRGPYYDPSAA